MFVFLKRFYVAELYEDVGVLVCVRGYDVVGRAASDEVFGELVVELELTRLGGLVEVNDVYLVFLEVAQGHEHEVSGADAVHGAFAHVSADYSEARDTWGLGQQDATPAVTEEVGDQCVVLTGLFEDQLAVSDVSGGVFHALGAGASLSEVFDHFGGFSHYSDFVF